MPTRTLAGGAAIASIAFVLVSVAGCSRPDAPATRASSTLTIGYGLDGGARVQPVVQILTQEGLLSVTPEGRPAPRLVKSWKSNGDGLTWTFDLTPDAIFHDGSPVTAQVVRDLLIRELPDTLGFASQNIQSIDAISPAQFEITLKRRSTFIPEALALNVPVHAGDSAGTGPFALKSLNGNSAEFVANDRYYQGKPLIDRIVIEPYNSVRAAWADLLRGRVDMVYEIGVDAFDSVKPATETRLFTFRRPYAYVVVFNMRSALFKDARVRRALNSAIDREKLVADTLENHGRPADGPIWPDHWTNSNTLPRFRYEPTAIDAGRSPLSFTCLYSEPSHERLAVFVQRELQAVGVDMRLEFSPVRDSIARAEAGNFDAWLADMNTAPNFFRQALFWHSQSAYNYGHYASPKVDAALDAIDQSSSDDAYKAGAEAFQRAVIDDPPGIFLAWSERLRAVNTRFEVHEEPGRDILNTLRLWRPLGTPPHPTN